MGIGGHMLGERKLRRLRRLADLDLDRAYIRGQYAEGRIVRGSKCYHMEINPKTGQSRLIENPVHWASCPEVK